MSPEICQRKEYCGYAADIWALGIIIFVMLTGTHPFFGKSESDLFSKISRGLFRTPENLDFEAKQLINKLLVINPNKRPRAIDLCQDRWISAGRGGALNTIGSFINGNSVAK